MKKTKVISIFIIMMLLMNLCLSGCAEKKSPAKQLTDSIITTGEQVQNKWVASSLYKVFNEGSASLSLNVKDFFESQGIDNLNISADLTCYYNKNNNSVMQLFTYLDDVSFADVSMYQIDNEFAIDSDVLFSGAYGCDLSDELIDDSTDTGYLYNIISSVSRYNSYRDLINRAEQLNETYLDLLSELLDQYGTTDSRTEDTQVNGKTVKADVVTIVIDNEGLAKVLNDLGTYFLADDEMRALLVDIGELMEDMDAENLTSDEFTYSVQDIYNSVEEELGSTVEQLRQSDIQCDTAFYINHKNDSLMAFDGTFMVDNRETTVNLTLGENIQDSNRISLAVNDSSNSYFFESKVNDDTETNYSSEFAISENSGVLLSSKIDWDKTTSAYSIEIEDSIENYLLKVTGTLEDKGAVKTIVIHDISYSDEEYNLEADLGMSIVLKEKDTLPSMPEYADISLLDTDEVSENINELTTQLYRYLYGF